MRLRSTLLVALFVIVPLAGCLGTGDGVRPASDPTADAPYLGYLPVDPDMALALVETDHILQGVGVDIHVRVMRPPGPGPFPVIAQFTPYTAPGVNVMLNNLAEPLVDCTGVVNCEGSFDLQFVRRGFAFAYGDVRGTGDSTGCLDLRGPNDIADLGKLIEWLGTQEWSNGNVGFIGASYPGSEAHMAGIAGGEYLKAIVPIVASTSFYHYHHNDGVPYRGQHSLGGTNTGYTQNAIMPTLSPHNANFGPRYVEEAAACDYKANMLDHGGLDQTGAYYDWWQERNLRGEVGKVQVPVLMAQGLADWNVKPDHIASWFNDLTVENKVLIAGQWGHAYPMSPCEDGDAATCDSRVPYGKWWQYVNAFFDTYLKGIDTGMFQGSTAWVQDTTGAWHRSTNWPLAAEERDELVLHLQSDGALGDAAPADAAEVSWYGCPDDQSTYGQGQIRTVDQTVNGPCEPQGDEELVFQTAAFEADTIISGVPLVKLTLQSETDFTHLVALVEIIDAKGTVVEREVRKDTTLTSRENYGYLNPTFRFGIDDARPITPGEPYTVTIDLYPQEDVIKAGERLRLTIRSDDAGRTIESYEPGTNTILLGPDNENVLWLPLRPLELQGTRLLPVTTVNEVAAEA